MLELAIVATRLGQYIGAAVLLGSPLFYLYALPSVGAGAAAELRSARALVATAAASLAVFSLLAIATQASLFAGSFRDGFTGEAMGAVVTSMALGKAAVVRATAATVALVLFLAIPAGRTSWLLNAALGAIATASLAWMGHAAATEGPIAPIHLVSDIVHSLAAAVWIGALVSFVLLSFEPSPDAEHRAALHVALQRFSGVGTAVVALILITGLVNGWVLVGWDGAQSFFSTAYGRLLSVKVCLFGAMLVLAVLNRFWLAPAIGFSSARKGEQAIRKLRLSVVFETGFAVAVLILVAWLGTLPPPAPT